MSIILKGIDLPNSGQIELIIRLHEKVVVKTKGIGKVEALQIPTPHGRLIDANKLEAMMYHEAFEIDSEMQKWDRGCWIRYKVFENCMNKVLPDTILEEEK